MRGAGQDTGGDEVVCPIPVLVPLIGETAAWAAAMLALQEAIMFMGSAHPSPLRQPKFVLKDQPTPPRASLNDPLPAKTMGLLKDNSSGQAQWCTLCEWPVNELLNGERKSRHKMGAQINDFVPKQVS